MTRKKRTLTDEEQSLWNRLAEKVKPLKPEKKHVVSTPLKEDSPCSGTVSRKKDLLPTLPEILADFQSPLDLPPSTHRIQRVRNVKVQARLDLHGFTRDRARLRLAQFLVSCQEQRHLWVLVITGKGQRNLTTETPYGTPAKKTLRELVPQWLEERTLRSIVSAYATAKPQDGGSGALYVRLKRLR